MGEAITQHLTIIKDAPMPPRGRVITKYQIVKDMEMHDAIDIHHELAEGLCHAIRHHHKDSLPKRRKNVAAGPPLARGMTRVWRTPKTAKKVLKAAR
tara:strand:+ start:470 stop:760 length:291 start_codon:yes stop_codon:yes gene_type:complete